MFQGKLSLRFNQKEREIIDSIYIYIIYNFSLINIHSRLLAASNTHIGHTL